MKTYEITSAQNDTFKLFQQLLTSQGIKKHGQALIFGRKVISEVANRHREQCVGIIRRATDTCDVDMGSEYILKNELFDDLDIFGSHSSILVVKIPEIKPWLEFKSEGCQLLLPFQEPSNIGATLRSAAAFGVKTVIMAQSAAHPFHPKSSRSASGNLFNFDYYSSGPLSEMSFGNNEIVALDMEGEDISKFEFPKSFVLVPGLEGGGLPKNLKISHRVKIPMANDVESLNAVVATSIALQRWFSQS